MYAGLQRYESAGSGSIPVLSPTIISLPHPLRGIVRLPKDLQDLIEGYLLRLVNDANDFRVIRSAGADLVVSRVLGVSTSVSDLCV